ncbi:MAG: hypothetical protein AAB943_00030 [Patescibacteria group bacterium]
MDRAPQGPIETNRVLLREKLSRYFNMAQEMNSGSYAPQVASQLESLLKDLDILDAKELNNRLEQIKQDALSVMENADAVTRDFKLAAEIRVGLAKR